MEHEFGRGGRGQRGTSSNYTSRGQRGFWRGQQTAGQQLQNGRYQRGGFHNHGSGGYNQHPQAMNNDWRGEGGQSGSGRGSDQWHSSNQPFWYNQQPAYNYIPMYVHSTPPPAAAPQYYVNHNVTHEAQPPGYQNVGGYSIRFPRQHQPQRRPGRGHFRHQQPQQQQSGRSGNWEAKRMTNARFSNTRSLNLNNGDGENSVGRTLDDKDEQNRTIVTEDDSTQRERLTEDLSSGEYECMVCCDRVRQSQPIWNCRNCYNIFHLGCVRKWARASTEEIGWRCPGCQHVTDKVPYDYLCFCGKRRDPEWNRYDTPHGCGEQCARKRRGQAAVQITQDECPHPCNLLCHPGPCPPCGTYVPRACKCGKLTQQVRCGQSVPVSCDEVCKKLLSCDQHFCEAVCHAGGCDPCSHKVEQGCFCGKEKRQVSCGAEEVRLCSDGYSCGEICGVMLDCGHHECKSACHPDHCEPCSLSPDAVTHCPCGSTPVAMLLSEERTKCTDPLPTCDKLCDKELECGPLACHHKCTSTCHVDSCPPCALKTSVACRCGHVVRHVECAKIFGEDRMVVTCEKRCNKRKSCGRHKCQNRCCADGDGGEGDHKCPLTCGRRLKCGLHSCDEPCHPGNCPPCWNTSFEELACNCGGTVTFPPVPCGTKPPECSRPCSRHHQCQHPVLHNCHSETKCPPCTYLTEKWCYGRHEKRTCIPCHQTAVCCGLQCSKPLPCERHKCTKVCHLGPCANPEASAVCTQPCPEIRPACGHPCGAPCHGGDCPSKGSCKTQVAVKCNCGERKMMMKCAERAQAHRRLVAAAVASKLRTSNDAVNLSEASQLINIDTVLDCNEVCAATERNKRVALALQIRNPDLSNQLSAPAYSDFLKDQSKQNPSFVASVYEKLTDLVQSAKKSKQKSRSHAFPPMRNDMRRVIHELAELFGCATQSYDEEPKKNVVVTAYRDKSWLPSVSLVTVVQKENKASRPAGKAPPPVPHYHVLRSATQQSEGQATTAAAAAATVTLSKEPANERTKTTNIPEEAVIDYFDYTG